MCQQVAVFPPTSLKLIDQKKDIHSKLSDDGSNVLAVIFPSRKKDQNAWLSIFCTLIEINISIVHIFLVERKNLR